MEIKKFDQETYRKIDRYLRGVMTEEEQVEFEIQVSLDKNLEEALKLRRLMVEAIKHKRKTELKDFMKRNSGIRYSGNIWGKNFTRFSAALIIFTGIFWIISDPDEEDMKHRLDHEENEERHDEDETLPDDLHPNNEQ